MSMQFTVLGFELNTLENESPPITTRPGLPSPNKDFFAARTISYGRVDSVNGKTQLENITLMRLLSI